MSFTARLSVLTGNPLGYFCMNQSTTWNDTTRHHDSLREVVRSYLQLTKPRIIPLLLIETAAAMWVCRPGECRSLAAGHYASEWHPGRSLSPDHQLRIRPRYRL